MGLVAVGIDMGDRRTPSAIAVVEGEWRPAAGAVAVPIIEDREVVGVTPPRTVDYALVRSLERLPPGTDYPALGVRLAEIIAGLHARGVSPTVYVDATGIGRPVMDTLQATANVPITPVYFTWGDRRAVGDDFSVTLGKAYLVARLQVLLQEGRLLLPRTAEAEALARDLTEYEVTMRPDANDTYGAFTVGAQDDLITALGLAVQESLQRPTILWG